MLPDLALEICLTFALRKGELHQGSLDAASSAAKASPLGCIPQASLGVVFKGDTSTHRHGPNKQPPPPHPKKMGEGKAKQNQKGGDERKGK